MSTPASLVRAARRTARTLLSRERATQRGAVLALVALGSVVLLGSVGLAVDGSRMLEERRAVQATADHAATAAAHYRCNNTSDPSGDANAVLAGLAIARLNGYDDASPRVSVVLGPVIPPGPGPDPDPYDFNAVVTSNIDGTFSRVLGFSNFDVSAEATASGTGCGQTGGGGAAGAIFAGGLDCGVASSLKTVKISGNEHDINGGSHTNGMVDITGNLLEFVNTPPDPSLTYVGPTLLSFKDTGSGNTYVPTHAPVAPRLWPTGFGPGGQTFAMWEAYRLAKANPTINPDKFDITTDGGVWYTDRAAGVDVESISPGVSSFIIVNKSGPVRMPKDHEGLSFTAATAPAGTPANVIVVSGFSDTQPCDQFGIGRSGKGGTFTGIWWAPNAQIRLNGNEVTVNGSLIGHAIQMEGNEHVINARSDFFPAPVVPTIIILK